MNSSKVIGYTFLFGGLVALTAGGYILYNRNKNGLLGLPLGFQDKKPKGRLIETFHKPTPVVEETILPNGMKMQHRRSNNMTIEERIGNLQDITWKSVSDPEMRKLALAITNNCPARDGKCEAEAIFNAVKKRIRYTGDIAPLKIGGRDGPVEPVDLYQSGKRSWQIRGGDCDDHAILIATLLTLNGITARFRVTAESKNADWSHVYVTCLLPKLTGTKPYALDTTLPNGKFGTEVPFAKYLDFAV